MALTNSDLLIVQRAQNSYKVTAGNLKSFVNAGDTQGTVTQISQGQGITCSPNPITSTGSVILKEMAKGGLFYDNSGAVYVGTDSLTVTRRSTDGALTVIKAPTADHAVRADHADTATTAGNTTGNSATATFAETLYTLNTDANTWWPLAFTGASVGNTGSVGNYYYVDQDDLQFNSSSNILWSRGGFQGTLDGNAKTATNADYATQIYVNANNSANAEYSIFFGSEGNAFRDTMTDTSLKYNPSTNTLTCANFVGQIVGGADLAAHATKAERLDPGRNINGTKFDGTVDITTQYWGAGRYINNQLIDGTANVRILNYFTNTNTTSIAYPTFVLSNSTGYHETYMDSQFYYNPSSNVVYATQFQSTSDIAFKKDIQPLENVLEKIEMIRGVSFKWKSNDNQTMGVIAQEVEKVYPELVDEGKDGLKSVNYGSMVAVCIEAIKELKAEVEELKAQLNK